MLPTPLKKFFWDAKFDTIDREANKSYIISRLLEMGDEIAVKWLEQAYSLEDLINVVKSARSLSSKSRNYWKLRYLIT
ncbi:MAG: hypothetical protein WC666_01445 [Candidatus Paceibacterota bacterium]|jgi:hypothetical protein